MQRARVIGIGQAAAGDDGVGLAVLDALERMPVPPGVQLLRVAEPTALIPLLEDAPRAVLVDAVVGAGQPGEVLTVPASAIDARVPGLVSTHGVSVGQAVALAEALSGERALADVWVVAVCIDPPEKLAHGLSEPVAAAVPRAARAVIAKLEEE